MNNHRAGRERLMDSRVMMEDSDPALLPGYGPSPSYGLCSGDSHDGIKTPRRRSFPWGVPYVAWCSLSAALISLVSGVSLGYTSPTLTELEAIDNPNQHIADKSVESSLFAALGVAGAPVGALLAWPVSDFCGRQPALMIGGIPAALGWLMLAYAHFIDNCRDCFFGALYAGRLLTSFSVGWSIFCISVYVSEISSAKWKGRFGNCNQLFITIGVLIAYALGIRWENGFQITYSTIALIAVGLILLFEILMCFTCESPRWLYKKNKNYSKVLRKLRGNVDLSDEVEELSKAAHQQYTLWEQVLEFKKQSVLFPFIIGAILMFFQQFGGIGAIVAYSTPIFEQAGFDAFKASLVTTFANGGVQIIVTFISALVIDHFGRKLLLITSSVGLIISTMTLGVYFFILDHKCSGYLGLPDTLNATTYCVANHTDAHCHFPCSTQHFGSVAIAGVTLFMSSFGIGWGPIVWPLMSELLPDQVRTLGGSIITFVNWTCATIVTLCFHFYVLGVTIQGAWWTFTFILVLSAVFVVVFLPETKGHSLKAIQDHFKKGHIFAIPFVSKSID